jgi:hypothetical protein
MTGSRALGVLFLTVFVSTCGAQRHSPDFVLTPAIVQAGAPEIIRVNAPGASLVTGEWLGHKIQFFQTKHSNSWFALAGVDVEAPIGPSKLRITAVMLPDEATFERDINIHPAHYRTGRLTVAPKFVEPGPEEQKEIAADSEIKAKLFSATAPEPLWQGSFRAPVKFPPTDSFGTRRMFNGKLASIHKGMDFRAPAGTVVRASNSGIVVLARHLYFEGNCVIIDHGLGLYTLSMHFSRIDVHEGQHVSAGDKLGLSGATGRVTGPHLHWAVRWQNAYLDPAKLLHLNLNTIR